jgi:Ca-activated chloride channel homolog
MFRFEHPTYLYALALIPVLTVFFYLTRRARRQALLRFGDENLVHRLMPQVSMLKHPLKFGVLMLAFTCLIVALANPQRTGGMRREKVQTKASDIIIALDISNSMLADDVKPNRLDRARSFALDLIRELKGERIGIVIFAGNADIQMPLTSDYTAAEMYLKSASPKQIPIQGTALSEAIDIAEEAFPKDGKAQKVVIVISDGEDQDLEALDRVKAANKKEMLVFTIGVGTAEGGFMAVDFNGLQDYKRDRDGQPIKTRLNETMLRDMASNGGGDYFNIANTSGVIAALKSRIEKVEKRESEMRSILVSESYFQWLLLPCLLILVLEFMMPYRKSKWESRDIFKV